MAGFADVPGTRIIVFYPKGGVSRIQELQMRTQKGENTAVVAIHGNFDDAQTGVKQIFGDQAFQEEMAGKGFQFSSANSINVGRLVPQVVYYVYAYARLLAHGEIGDGEEINVVVPTGNFGNILAAYFAKMMGTPIHKLICASNDNKVLYDFFTTGIYDRNREFILTSSPSMDILISSNLERLIYLSAGCSPEKNWELMEELKETGRYAVTPQMKEKMGDFWGGFADQEENGAEIKRVFADTGYLMDTHTGVASAVYQKYVRETGDRLKAVIASTASPYKFAPSVMEAITGKKSEQEPFVLIDEMSALSKVPVPKAVDEIRSAPIRHGTVHRRLCDPCSKRNRPGTDAAGALSAEGRAMLGDISVADEIYIVCGYTDMRRSIDGLCGIVQERLRMDPRRSALYLFCGRRCDRIKALLWERDGFLLLYKRMEVQGRFRWPRNSEEAKAISWQQFDWLMSGLEIEQPKAFRPPENIGKVQEPGAC